eukprot:TRINITY_DN3539_c0_g2_i1.p1 TRINITY_DN3539_c0_g2~~TRINITY_DN3539_c0_g2_i1.p1  ORF type:complete len:2104 (+),score=260.43 TRINITY_DN3539_c0_g2_i1:139-6450(+)
MWCLATLLAVATVGQAFLDTELPLTLVSTTPSDIDGLSQDEDPVRLYDSQTLTAVFSRPIVALGSDFGQEELPADKVPFTLSPNIPGGLYWVTSYIARFDPVGEWPRDLDLTLTWNTELTTYDGIKLTWSENAAQSLKLETSSLSVSCNNYDIESPLGMFVTGGRYDNDREFLPGSILSYSFYGGNVSLPLMQDVLKLQKERNSGSLEDVEGINIIVQSCLPGGEIFTEDGDPVEDDCLKVALDAPLDQGAVYQLTFPAGSIYSRTGIRKRESSECEIKGPFDFELFDIYFDSYWQDISARRIQTLLSHGLSSRTTLQDLKKVITILKSETGDERGFDSAASPIAGSDIDFELELTGKAVLTIIADFEPGQAYVLQVSASNDVQDAFGFPLVSQTIKLQASDWPVFDRQPYTGGYDTEEILSFYEGSGWDGIWPVVIGGGEQYEQTISYWSMPLDDELIQDVLILCTFGYDSDYHQESTYIGTRICNNVKDYLGEPAFTVNAKDDDKQAQLNEIDMGSLLRGGSGVVVYQSCCDDGEIDDVETTEIAYEMKVVQERSIAAVIMAKQELDSVVVAVWSLDDGTTVEGAEVMLYKIVYIGGDDIPSKIGTTTTDADGVARFQDISDESSYKRVVAVIKTTDGKMVVSETLTLYGFEASDRAADEYELQGNLFVDHKLARPGEGFYVSGYVRQLNSEKWEVPDEDITFYLQLQQGLSTAGQRVKLEITDGAGSFVTPIDTSLDLVPEIYDIELMAAFPDGSEEEIDSITVTGSSPRTPTAALTVIAPSWARPNSTFPIEVTTVSYIGASLKDEEIKVQWDYYSDIQQENIQGSFTIVTNENGTAVTIIDLQDLAPDLQIQDTFRLDFEYIGPTRECLTDAKAIQMRKSEYTVNLMTSVTEVKMPGFEFGVYAKLQESDQMTGDEEFVDQPIEIQLIRSDGEIESECTVTANVVDFSACRIVLQQATNYTLNGCITDSTNTQVCDKRSLGKSLESWKEEPAVSHEINWIIVQSQALYFPGDTAELMFENYVGGSKLFLYAHSSLGDKALWYNSLEVGLNTVQFEIEPFCYYGCKIQATLVVPENNQITLVEELHVSKLLNMNAPTYYIDSITIEVEQPSTVIDIDLKLTSIQGPQDSSVIDEPIVVQPEEAVRLDVTSMLPVGDVTDAEVIVFVVDRSILDVVPTPIVNSSEIVALDLQGESLEYEYIGNLMQNSNAINLVRDFFFEVNTADPFLVPSFSVLPTDDSVADVDIGLEEYLLRNADELGYIRGARPFPTLEGLGDDAIAFLQQAAAEENSLALPERDLEKIGQGIKYKEFRYLATPVHAVLETDEEGTATIAFNAPINLGRFNIRAYGATTNNRFGVGELDFIVRRALSLTVAAPRQVRVQDSFQAGVIITISEDQVRYFDGDVITVDVTAEVIDPIIPDVEGDLVTSVAVVVGEPVEIGFQFSVDVLGEGEVKFTATDSTGSSDSRKATIPVNGQQGPVSLATSFAVQGSVEGSTWWEGLQIPEAVAGSGTIEVSAGVGRLPAIQAYTNALMEDLEDDDPNNPSASKAVASVVIDSILNNYGTIFEEVSSANSKALNDLTKLTKEDNGLQWYIPRAFYRAISISLNAWALWATQEASAYKTMPSAVSNLRDTWESKMLSQLVEDAEWYRSDDAPLGRPKAYPIISNIAKVRLAVGVEWTPQSDVSELVEDLSASRLYSEMLNDEDMYLGLQVDIALIALSDTVNQKAADILEMARRNILGNVNVRGRASYINSRRGSNAPADLETQSKALIFLLRNGDGDNPVVEKLANFIGSQSAYAHTMVSATLSLAQYDKTKGSTDPDLELNVRSGDLVMLKAKFDEPTEPIVNITSFDALASPPEPLEFKAVGVGEVSLAALMNFIPSVLYPFPQYRGIFVESAIQDSDELGEAVGPALGTVQLTSVVNYVIQLSTPFDVGAAEVHVLLPGGLEAVDPNVPTCTPGGSQVCYAGRFDLDIYSRWYYPSCPKMEVYPDRVIFRYAYMREGTHDISFKAIAATKGEFVLPPVQAFSVQEPEIMGLSAAGSLSVCENCESVALDLSASIPIECPNDCSGFGVCNVSSGECICNVGSTGADCSEIVIE